MGLALVVGPANAGKVALLLDRYLDALDREPVLIVPNRSDVDRVERDLLARRPALLAGTIGTFDDLFERLAYGDGEARPLVGPPQRGAARPSRGRARRRSNGLGRSARFAGFADALAARSPRSSPGCSSRRRSTATSRALYAAYRAELDRLGLWDREPAAPARGRAAAADLDAWRGEPVFAYGFEDLTGAEWALLEALAGRTEVTCRCPTSRAGPRSRRSSARRTTSPRLAARPHRGAAAARTRARASGDRAPRTRAVRGRAACRPAARRRGAVPRGGRRTRRRSSSSARRSSLSSRAGTPRRADRRRRPSLERLRAPLDTAFGTLGIPYAVDGARPARRDAVRRRRCSRCSASHGSAAAAASSSASCARRTPGSPARASTSSKDGSAAARSTTANVPRRRRVRLRDGAPLPPLDDPARREGRRVDGGRATLAAQMLRHAHGLEAPPAGEAARADLRAHERSAELLDELERWRSARRDALARGRRSAALERPTVRVAARRRARPRGRPRPDARTNAALRRRLRPRPRAGQPAAARTRRRRSSTTTRGGARRAPARPAGAARSGEPRPLPLLHGVHAAARAPVSRARSGNRRGQPARAEPVLGRGAGGLRRRGRRRWTRRRPLSALTWSLDGRRPSASGCARSRSSRRTTRAAPTRSRARTAGSGGSSARGARSRGRHASQPARARAARRRGRRSTSPSSSGSPTARRPGSSSVPSPAVDRRRGRREAARLGRAQRALQVLRADAEGARRAERSTKHRRRRGAPHARVPRRGAPGRAAWT